MCVGQLRSLHTPVEKTSFHSLRKVIPCLVSHLSVIKHQKLPYIVSRHPSGFCGKAVFIFSRSATTNSCIFVLSQPVAQNFGGEPLCSASHWKKHWETLPFSLQWRRNENRVLAQSFCFSDVWFPLPGAFCLFTLAAPFLHFVQVSHRVQPTLSKKQSWLARCIVR